MSSDSDDEIPLELIARLSRQVNFKRKNKKRRLVESSGEESESIPVSTEGTDCPQHGKNDKAKSKKRKNIEASKTLDKHQNQSPEYKNISQEKLENKTPVKLQNKTVEILKNKTEDKLQNKTKEILHNKSQENLKNKASEELENKTPVKVKNKTTENVIHKTPEKVQNETPEKLQNKMQVETSDTESEISNLDSEISNSESEISDSESYTASERNSSDSDYSDYSPGVCEVKKCKRDGFAAYQDDGCEMVLCFEHNKKKNKKKRNTKVTETPKNKASQQSQIETPEHYIVEGEGKEFYTPTKKEKKDKKKERKNKRNSGLEYISSTKQIKPPRQMKARCGCKAKHFQCSLISDEERQQVFSDYWKMSDINLQWGYLQTHITVFKSKRKLKEGPSRRNFSKTYFLQTNQGKKLKVCKNMFLNTFSISEKTTRTALNKKSQTGMLAQRDNRGGRPAEFEKSDEARKDAVIKHIQRFPAVESHYCREKTKRTYLSEDLSFKKMYQMFCSEIKDTQLRCGYTFYSKMCREKKVSIHRPKKDQCSLCESYKKKEVNDETLKPKYDDHIAQKQKVRQLKDDAKEQAKSDPTVLCGNFDLQQVIYLPQSQDGQLFYKRRLSNFNLTFYNIASKQCDCFLWNESQGKRGSSEISTAVYKALEFYDAGGVKKAFLFSDGCGGQNKNSIVPAMLLNFVLNSKNMKEISLRYFVTNHGQCEGDSAHSAINHAIKRAGNIFQTCQLESIMKGARRAMPYRVHMLEHTSFLDFKTMAKDMRILESRTDKVDWGDIMEIKVSKEHPGTVFYKVSHTAMHFNEINLKRLLIPTKDLKASQLYEEPLEIPKNKYDDLVKLCSGDTPVVHLKVHQDFYKTLKHD